MRFRNAALSGSHSSEAPGFAGGAVTPPWGANRVPGHFAHGVRFYAVSYDCDVGLLIAEKRLDGIDVLLGTRGFQQEPMAIAV